MGTEPACALRTHKPIHTQTRKRHTHERVTRGHKHTYTRALIVHESFTSSLELHQGRVRWPNQTIPLILVCIFDRINYYNNIVHTLDSVQYGVFVSIFIFDTSVLQSTHIAAELI